MDEVNMTADQNSNSWLSLRTFTDARIALARAGSSISSQSLLNFKLDHAHARDAVYSTLDFDFLLAALEKFGLEVRRVQSQVSNRVEYLQRPDRGRRLRESSRKELETLASQNRYDISIILVDGLSATAVNENSAPLLTKVIPMLRDSGFTISTTTLVEQGRVAIGDEIGSLLKSQLSLLFIGERPGLSSPNSLGAYLTYNPTLGLTDESRNCVSNIRPGGLTYADAAEKIFYLICESMKRKLSGVLLKDNSRFLN